MNKELYVLLEDFISDIDQFVDSTDLFEFSRTGDFRNLVACYVEEIIEIIGERPPNEDWSVGFQDTLEEHLRSFIA